MEDQNVEKKPPVVVDTTKKGGDLRIKSLVTIKTSVALTVGGQPKVITLLPQQTAKLSDTHEVREQLARYIKANTIKIL
jgi:hypothetical protein